MYRPRFALLAAIVCAAPAPALAQAWPASAVVSVASVRPLAPLTRAFQVADVTPIARPEPPSALKLRPRTALDADPPPPVDIRPKAEWTDDQGFSATPKRISYKLRF